LPEKFPEELLLCATSVFSVSPWFNFPKKNNHSDTENTEVAQRRVVITTFWVKPVQALAGVLGGTTMGELLQEYTTEVVGPDGSTYTVRSYGEERDDGTWIGWLEFEPIDPEEPTLATGQETSQPNRTAVEYWATGLEAIYFEGAFQRAHRK
jgi:hypothetical protein